jgi:hypothetical protein
MRAVFGCHTNLPIEYSQTRPAYRGVVAWLGCGEPPIVKVDYVELNANLFALARSIVSLFPAIETLRFVKFDVSIWRSGEDVNLINGFLKNSDLNYDSLLRSVLVGETATRDDWTTLVFLCLTFGWDAVLCCADRLTVVVFSHDSWVGFSGKDMAKTVKTIFS